MWRCDASYGRAGISPRRGHAGCCFRGAHGLRRRLIERIGRRSRSGAKVARDDSMRRRRSISSGVEVSEDLDDGHRARGERQMQGRVDIWEPESPVEVSDTPKLDDELARGRGPRTLKNMRQTRFHSSAVRSGVSTSVAGANKGVSDRGLGKKWF